MLLSTRLPALVAALLLAMAFVAASAEKTAGESSVPESEDARAASEVDQAADTEDDVKDVVAPGSRVFMVQNCALCHTAYSRGIGESPDEAVAGGSDSGQAVGPSGPPDLSVLEPHWTAEVLREYLVERSPVDGEKHVTGFRGSEEEWSLLADWMLRAPDAADTTAQGSGQDEGEDGESEQPGASGKAEDDGE